MNNVERISVIIPKFKQQLLFLEEREKLFRTDVALIELDGSSTSITTTQSSSIITIPRSSSFSTSTSQSSSFNTSTSQSSSFNTSTSQSFTATATNSPISIFTNESSMDCLSKSPTNIFTPDRYNNDTNIHQLFTDQYNIPSLPNNLIKDIEDGDMIKFGPHFSNRQILIDAVSYDLINNYKLLKTWLPVLDDLCDVFHRSMVKYFPHKIIPKCHFVREYSQVIRDYGPAVRYWCFSNLKHKANMVKSSIKYNVTISIYRLEYDVDGSTLKLMNNVERISIIIPKFKQKLLFLEEREKLFQTDVTLTELDGSSTSITTTQSSSIITIPRSSSFSTSTSQSSSFNTNTSQSFTATATNSPISIFNSESSTDCLSKSPTNIFTPDRYNNDTNIHQLFTDQYNIPSLPNNLIKDIEDGDMIKFGPHFSNRQILIDAVSYDLINNYKLLKTWLPVLDDLCDVFHRSMVKYFPHKIIPKCHFVREYSQVIRDYGPAVRYWCFRTNNFKNTPKMLATHFQFKQCYKFSRFSPLGNNCYPVRLKTVDISLFNKTMKNLLLDHFGHIDYEKNLFQCWKLIYDNIEYYQSAVHVIGLRNDDEQSIFAQIIFILKTKYDVDGSTLKLMNNVERISIIIPKFKQQLLFLEEREKLFRTDVTFTELDGSSTSITTTQSSSIITIPRSSSFSTSTSESSSFNTNTSQSFTPTATNSPISIFTSESSTDCLSKSPTNIFTPDRYNNGVNIHELFADQYNIPSLLNNLIKDIEDGDMIKFGPHFSNRQILIDAVSYDLINNYKLFYPSPKQFDQIGSAIVKFLRLPLIKNNIDYRSKYSRAGSGRPVKRRINEVAQRDRFKQLMVIPYNDHIANNIEEKINQLQDVSEIDAETRLKLWKETFSCRREYVRIQSTFDIVQKFPGYADSFLIFEEVKMLLQIDLAAAIRRQTSVTLNKIISSPVFITGR
ncbi:unnamed protein product [Adineta steineri]|uniref:Uncharacterized protein n=1 Tax=Adineta steineri TaxID=433720 RepID=A0A815F0J7_9BILA|nr:unnamed protein product [Adineta steineri]